MKKMMSFAAAAALIIGSCALPFNAGAAEKMCTEVTYFAGDMNAVNPDCFVSGKYTVIVPACVGFGKNKGYSVEFSGITANDLTVSAAQRIAMQSAEGVTEAVVEFETVEIAGDLTAEQRKSSPLSVDWENAPNSGVWTGVITYSVK